MKTQRTETIAQVLILLLVAGMAGAASFTHVHDWTMHNTPPGTGSWFGWANAVITELVPAAAGIEIRRRKRQHLPVTFPMAVLITDAAVSLTAQLSDALHTLAGGLAFALPALAFLALTKLVLSRTGTTTEDPSCAQTTPDPGARTQAEPLIQTASAPSPATTGMTAPAGSKPLPEVPVPTTEHPTAIQTAAAPALTPEHLRDLRPVPSGQLLISARMTAFSHQQETGQPITPGQLADRLAIPPALAESLLDHLGGTTPPPVTVVNGIALPVEGRP